MVVGWVCWYKKTTLECRRYCIQTSSLMQDDDGGGRSGGVSGRLRRQSGGCFVYTAQSREEWGLNWCFADCFGRRRQRRGKIGRVWKGKWKWKCTGNAKRHRQRLKASTKGSLTGGKSASKQASKQTGKERLRCCSIASIVAVVINADRGGMHCPHLLYCTAAW